MSDEETLEIFYQAESHERSVKDHSIDAVHALERSGTLTHEEAEHLRCWIADMERAARRFAFAQALYQLSSMRDDIKTFEQFLLTEAK